ncbi:MAG: hypothetical protein CSA81_13160 [Acidobacteria bacterium]|nr:MAG: hypothetical protein CSA81_13160 [Acidobacteriota bacterium]
MFSLLTCCFLLNLPVLEREIVLQTNHLFLGDIQPHRSLYAEDGTLILGAQHQIFHFDLNTGKLIRFFGRNGQGPLEFGDIRAVNWDGSYYFIVDARALKTSLVDASGKLIWCKPCYFRGLNGTHELMVGDCKTAKLAEYRIIFPTLKLFKYTPKGIEFLSDYFHPVSQKCLDLGRNYSIHFIDMDEKHIFVIDQVHPEVFVYDKQSLKQVRRMTMKMPGFVSGPDSFPKFGMPPDMRKYWKWHWSWSRINSLTVENGKIIVGYDLTCKEVDGEVCNHPQSAVHIYDMATADGRSIKIENGWVLGAKNQNIIVFYDWDDEQSEDPYYVVKMYKMP